MQTKSEVKQAILCDWNRYSDYQKESNTLLFVMKHPGAKLTKTYRWMRYYKEHGNKVMFFLYRLLYHRQCQKAGCDIPARVFLGSGLCLPHPRGIVINSQTIVGENVTILGNVVIEKTEKGTPQIGNNVYIGANAVIIGSVKVEDDCVVGAGAVVTHHVAKKQTVVGNPAREIKRKYTKCGDGENT